MRVTDAGGPPGGSTIGAEKLEPSKRKIALEVAIHTSFAPEPLMSLTTVSPGAAAAPGMATGTTPVGVNLSSVFCPPPTQTSSGLAAQTAWRSALVPEATALHAMPS